MSGRTSIVSSTPGFVAGTYGAAAIRNATLGVTNQGVLGNGDFAVTTNSSATNPGVIIGTGRAYVQPSTGTSTFRGPYYCENTSAFNTYTNGGYSWTAPDATNPRIDLVCLEVRDTVEDASGATGWNIRVVDGTPNASATDVFQTAYYPAVPAGCLPLAYVRVPSGATAAFTSPNILNVNARCGRAVSVASSAIATAESTASTSYVRLATPDVVTVVTTSANARIRLSFAAEWKISTASGTQSAAIHVNGSIPNFAITQAGATPNTAATSASSLNTFYSRLLVEKLGTITGASSGVADLSQTFPSFVTTGNVASTFDLMATSAGVYVIDLRFKTTANTLTVRNRYLWAEVIESA